MFIRDRFHLESFPFGVVHSGSCTDSKKIQSLPDPSCWKKCVGSAYLYQPPTASLCECFAFKAIGLRRIKLCPLAVFVMLTKWHVGLVFAKSNSHTQFLFIENIQKKPNYSTFGLFVYHHTKANFNTFIPLMQSLPILSSFLLLSLLSVFTMLCWNNITTPIQKKHKQPDPEKLYSKFGIIVNVLHVLFLCKITLFNFCFC